VYVLLSVCIPNKMTKTKGEHTISRMFRAFHLFDQEKIFYRGELNLCHQFRSQTSTPLRYRYRYRARLILT